VTTNTAPATVTTAAPTLPAAPPDAELDAALAQFTGLATNNHAGIDSLFLGWQRVRP
jgi:hypothetical protein